MNSTNTMKHNQTLFGHIQPYINYIIISYQTLREKLTC